MKTTFLSLFLGFIGTVAMCAAATKPTPVEVWTGGDDGLTQRLRNEIENRFKSSSDFALSHGKKRGTLIVTIPTHVAWTPEGTRTHVHYKVEYSSGESNWTAKNSGSCWDDELTDCAGQIYRGAQMEAKKLH